MHRHYDPSGIDFGVSNNNLEVSLEWRRAEAGAEARVDAWETALDHLAVLWWPDRVYLTLAPLAELMPEEHEQHVEYRLDSHPGDRLGAAVRAHIDQQLADRRRSRPDAGWGLLALESDILGWMRVAVPAGADLGQPLRLVSADDVGPQAHVFVPAPPLHGQDTRWLRLSDVSAESHLRVSVASPMRIEARLTLGLWLFEPARDPRAATHPVKGVSLAAWQDCSRAMLDATLARLADQGWSHRRR